LETRGRPRGRPDRRAAAGQGRTSPQPGRARVRLRGRRCRSARLEEQPIAAAGADRARPPHHLARLLRFAASGRRTRSPHRSCRRTPARTDHPQLRAHPAPRPRRAPRHRRRARRARGHRGRRPLRPRPPSHPRSDRPDRAGRRPAPVGRGRHPRTAPGQHGPRRSGPPPQCRAGRCRPRGPAAVAGRRRRRAAARAPLSPPADPPPPPVPERAPLVVAAPRGIVPALRGPVRPSPAGPTLAEAAARPDEDRSDGPERHSLGRPEAGRPALSAESDSDRLPSALLLDHGGVISSSAPDELGLAAFTARLAEGLSPAGHATTADQAASGLAAGRSRHKEWTAAHESVGGGPVPEIDPVTFWAELVGPDLPGDPDAVAAWLHAEAHRLMYDYSRVKSERTLRPGIVELLRTAGDLGIPVGIVSNTVSGRGIRSLLESQGLLDLIAAHAYSDEIGRRKPDPSGVQNVLTAVDADPRRAWFVGDKPHRDVPAARAGGVGTVVIVRGGATGDDELEEAFASDPALRPDHLLD